MKIILSPAKTMADPEKTMLRPEIESEIIMTRPVFEQRAQALIRLLKGFSEIELKALFKVSDAIARKTLDQINGFGETRPVPAIFAFQGAVYKALAPEAFTGESLVFCRQNLVILSALYGVLNPFDAVFAHRLDFTCKLECGANMTLRKFWTSPIHEWFDENLAADEFIVNLASDEYASLVTKGGLKARVITLAFMEKKGGVLKTVAAHSKQARGLFLRQIVQQRVTEPGMIKSFKVAGYTYDGKISQKNRWVFVLK
ncbi:conserved hypothetical protein [Desulforapulum autotrophicum HRM2]|uniref:UPF0246 protein HRM2_41860 n=2 Tax=Desulforapulum autotrophicum TaxID=2296 RepID=Y4186_DESAH|nr:RecName: Full=UPF0246 protein HRM2_41860 [Desulforapulum autotrophicum HRM2]ACN17242.1 conserved hypothetical protein [Desulforapulum autotrophicum HRM2]